MSPGRPSTGEARSGRTESDTLDAIETRAIRALFVTLEFSSHSFSGNGTLSQACVRGLSAATGVDVTVLSATPTEGRRDDGSDIENVDGNENETEETETEERAKQERLHGATALVEVPVPRSLWGRLDARSPWREFRDGAARALAGSNVDPRSFDVVFAVDFSGVAAAEALFEREPSSGPPPPLVYLNFRVFSRTAEEGEEKEAMRRAEGRAVAFAAEATVALCDDDAAALSRLAEEVLEAEGARGERTLPLVDVVLPPLRREFEEMPPPSLEGGDDGEKGPDDDEDGTTSPFGGSEKENEGGNGHRRSGSGRRRTRAKRRNLLLCCVRLSAEKEPHRFADVVDELSRSGALDELGLVPALVGGGDGAYAREVRERVASAVERGRSAGGGEEKGPLVVVERGFVRAPELASRFFDRTLLNFHPCLADAYGMSAVEAASRGAPSVIHREGLGGKVTVGASALLRPERGESFALDLSLPARAVAEQVASIARDEGKLREVAKRASERARSWSERESGEELASVARRVVAR